LIHRAWIETLRPNSLRQFAVPREKDARRAAFAFDMYMDGFGRDGDNLAEVTVWVHVIVGQGNALSYSK
jgi:hypothetical protein